MKAKKSTHKPEAKPAVNRSESQPPPAKIFPIVGIGASAGGYEAFTQLLTHLPRQTGMAFVLVQHLAPKHESALADLLSRSTSIPVTEVKDGMPVKPDQIYVIPPNASMGILDGTLHLIARAPSVHHMPIDFFLQSLATERGDKAIGVILSGTASDGTLGLKAIKAEGGITFAQDEKSARYADMPRNAVATGCVDFVLPPEGIAQELLVIAQHPYLAQSRAAEQMEQLVEGDADLKKVFVLLRNATGVDFTHYKHTTIRRRIRRRMALNKIGAMKDYVRHLQEDRAEVDALYQDILIHVTGFFRDPDLFRALKAKVFPALMKDRAPDQAFRIWVPGCSTGEEVYSLAISLLEFLGDAAHRTPIQIFGTDISDPAIEKARSGFYLENIAAEVSDDRLKRFFVKVQQGYQISKSIREMCIFARQNVVKDPPFSRMDLISCRNVLIYLDSVLQKRVLPIFHYALKPTGFLVLGSSETTTGFKEYFEESDKKLRIYVKRHTVSIRPMDLAGDFEAERGRALKKADESASAFDLQREADRLLLSKYVPAGVVVNQDLQILHFRGRTGPFLEPAPGQASMTLPKMAREGLLLELRTAIHRAKVEGTPVRRERIQFRSNGSLIETSMEVVPIKGPAPEQYYFLILFQETPKPAPPESKLEKAKAKNARAKAEEHRIADLQHELAQTRANLQSVIEQQETTNEELRSANEEILSSNEELQSTNEEMETAKEELQSTNEELTTLNEELQNRNLELGTLNSDLSNLLNVINIPIIMVGSDLRVRRFTSQGSKVLNLLPSDVGRPITDIRPQINISDLEQIITETIETLSLKEREVQDRQGRWYSMYVRPYVTAENKIDGAVISLTDVSALKTSLEQVSAYAEAIVESVHDSLLVLDNDLRVKTANRAFLQTFQATQDETLERPLAEVGNGQWNKPDLLAMLREIPIQRSQLGAYEAAFEIPGIGTRMMELNAWPIQRSGATAELILLTAVDVTDHRRDVEAMRKSRAMFESLFESAPDAFVAVDEKGSVVRVNAQLESLFGYNRSELVGQPVETLIPEGLRPVHRRHRADYLADTRRRPMGVNLELSGRRKDGSEFPVDVTLSPIETGDGKLVVAVVRDVTERRRGLVALREREERLRQLAEGVREGLWIADVKADRLIYANPAFERITGQPRERLLVEKATFWMESIHPDDRKAVLAAVEAGRKGKEMNEHFRISGADGSVRWLVARAFAIKDESKEAVRLVGIVDDITEQHQFSSRQIQVQDEERQRISRDLHDATGPILTGLVANLALLNECKTPLDGKARKALAESLKLAKQVANEIRTVSYLLHPPLLDELGLASVLRWYTEGFSQRSGINVQLDLPLDLGRLPAEAEKALFRVVQESLTNVHLHSGSTVARVSLSSDGFGYRLEVRDKGKGIPAEQLDKQGRGGLGVGIAGMKERMLQLGGRLEIESSPAGTTVRATLPKN